MLMEVLVEEFQNLKIIAAKLDDPRTDINILHPVENIIAISITAIVAGAEGPKSIVRWAEEKKDWLATWLPLPQGKKAESLSASSSTIRPETASKDSIKGKQQRASWSHHFLAQVLCFH